MKIKIVEGLSNEVYKYVSPYAMNLEFIRKIGNPITTSDKKKWVLGFDGPKVIVFCSLKFAETSKTITMADFISLDPLSIDPFIKYIKDYFFESDYLTLRAYANSDTIDLFLSNKFTISIERKNWKTLKLENERLRSIAKKDK